MKGRRRRLLFGHRGFQEAAATVAAWAIAAAGGWPRRTAAGLPVPPGLDGTYTPAEFDRLPCPPCPVCGTRMPLEPIDLTLNARDLAANGRRYIVGPLRCLRGCNPATGERSHAWTEITSDLAGTVRFRCACGTDETCDAMRAWQLSQEHRGGSTR